VSPRRLVFIALQVALAGVVVAAVVAFASDGGDPAPPAADDGAAAAARKRPSAARFDARRAFADLRSQVELGPRPAGSRASRRLAERIRSRLPGGRFEPVPGGLRNVVGRLPGKRPAIVVAAHYDTKDLPGFVGANDGAGGTAAVLELARALRKVKRPKGAPEIRFVFFDGEEATDDHREFLETGVRGAKAYAARHAKEIRALVLLDFVAEKGAMRIPREASSDIAIWTRLRKAAKRVGSGAAFPDATQGTVEDDHTPFLQRGIRAVDLIDFTFPCWHKTCDDLSAVSEHSLDVSGEAVLELLRTWR
jgi:glutaminyl-peptide cyclotransferase